GLVSPFRLANVLFRRNRELARAAELADRGGDTLTDEQLRAIVRLRIISPDGGGRWTLTLRRGRGCEGELTSRVPGLVSRLKVGEPRVAVYGSSRRPGGPGAAGHGGLSLFISLLGPVAGHHLATTRAHA